MSTQVGGVVPRLIEGYAVESSVRDNSVQRENAGWYAPGQSAETVVGLYNVAAAGSLSVPLLNVPAGKVFIITDVWISADTATAQKMQLVAGPSAAAGIPIMRGVLKGDTAPIELPGIESQPAVLPGQTLFLVSDAVAAVTNFMVTISGVQQAIGVG